MGVAQLEEGGRGQVGTRRVAAHDERQPGEARLQPAHRLDNLGDDGWDRHCTRGDQLHVCRVSSRSRFPSRSRGPMLMQVCVADPPDGHRS